MKNIIYLILLALISCNDTNNFYQGRVTDENNNPLVGVIVAEDRIEKHVKTDKNGYFKLDRSPNWLGNLIFVKEGYKTDTLPTVWHQVGETTEYDFIKNDTTIVRLKLTKNEEKLDLTVTQPKSKKREIPKSWRSLAAIQKDWIKVEKDENGYLIYEPCDGSTPTISLNDGFSMKWQIEPAYKFYRDKFTLITGNKSFRLDAYDNEKDKTFEVFAEIVDSKNGLVLWKFNNEKWLMTPIENSNNFRHIKNNCPDYKRGELQFNEPNYE